jgi:hypothetical protein
MGAINFNDGLPYDRLDVASAQATATSDGVEIAVTAYVFGQPAATVSVHDPARPGHRPRARGPARPGGGDGVARARRPGVMPSTGCCWLRARPSGTPIRGEKSCKFA